MLVNAAGEMKSKWSQPKFALIQPSVEHRTLTLRAPNMDPVSVNIDAVVSEARTVDTKYGNIWRLVFLNFVPSQFSCLCTGSFEIHRLDMTVVTLFPTGYANVQKCRWGNTAYYTAPDHQLLQSLRMLMK